MTEQIVCPSCKARLQVPGQSSGPYTCPRCLTVLDGSRVGQAIQAGAAAPPTEVKPSCPACGEAVQQNWLACPACGQRLTTGTALPFRDYRRVDVEIRRDQRATGAGAICLMVLGGIGLFFMGPLGWLIFGVILLVGLVTARLQTKNDPQAAGYHRMFGATIQKALFVAGIVVVSLLGMMIFLFVSCLAVIGVAGGLKH